MKEKVCRKSLSAIFQDVSDKFNFDMTMSHGVILANVFFKNLCAAETPRNSKESKQKIIKLAN